MRPAPGEKEDLDPCGEKDEPDRSKPEEEKPEPDRSKPGSMAPGSMELWRERPAYSGDMKTWLGLYG